MGKTEENINSVCYVTDISFYNSPDVDDKHCFSWLLFLIFPDAQYIA